MTETAPLPAAYPAAAASVRLWSSAAACWLVSALLGAVGAGALAWLVTTVIVVVWAGLILLLRRGSNAARIALTVLAVPAMALELIATVTALAGLDTGIAGIRAPLGAVVLALAACALAAMYRPAGAGFFRR